MTMNFHLQVIEEWLTRTTGRPVRKYGKPGGRHEGFSDGTEGVQLNAGIDRERGIATVGVNLEGMKYRDWPIATLLLRERHAPRLPALLRSLSQSDRLEIWLERDVWQAAARLPIEESFVGPPGPVGGAALTESLWATMVQEALTCLDSARHHRGRGRQVVTLAKAGRQEKDVSPHLQVKVPIPLPRLSDSTLDEAAATLRPVKEWMRKACEGR